MCVAVSAVTMTGLVTGGFHLVDTSASSIVTLLATDALMFAGRVGPISFASALALIHCDRLYRYPEERPIIG